MSFLRSSISREGGSPRRKMEEETPPKELHGDVRKNRMIDKAVNLRATNLTRAGGVRGS